MLWYERPDAESDTGMDVDVNTPTHAGITPREISPELQTGEVDDQAMLDDPDIALAARIAVSMKDLLPERREG